MAKDANRIPSLDGLRTISIALVIAGHMFHVFGFGDTGNLGNLGVRVFFVISGFLITGLLTSELERTGTINLLKFYFRRTLRIFPPYYFYLLVIGVVSAVGVASVPRSSLLMAALYSTDYLSVGNWLLGHTWSLAVEEQFYLLLPGLLLLAGLRRAKFVLFAIVLLLPLARLADLGLSGPDQIWVLKGFHANMDSLAVGCLMSIYRPALHRSGRYTKLISSPMMILLPVIILAANFQTEHPHIFLGASISIMNVAIALCIDRAVTNSGSVAGRVLNSAPMMTLGVMSYSIYLWQQPFFNPDVDSPITRFPLNFLCLAAMALVSYYLVEKRFLDLRQRLEAKLFGQRKSVPDNGLSLETIN